MADTCRSCHAPIAWVVPIKADGTEGKRLPLDPTPAADGNIILLDKPHVRVFGTADKAHAAHPGAVLFRSHFSTCPFAANHRKNR